jgi:superfamily II DNA or RNA helicase
LRDLETGAVLVVTSCELISEGFDLPAVEACILLRPTASMGMHLQMIGRCLRPAPGKGFATILDHVGNLRLHGLAEDPREWSLEGKKKKQTTPLHCKTCPKCFAMHRPAPECPECGHVYAIPRPKLPTVREGELTEIFKLPTAAAVVQLRTRAEVMAFAKARGFKPGFVYHTCNQLFLTNQYR